MTTYRSTYQRISRRELYSPRSVVAITLAILTIATLLWLIVEIVLNLLGRPGLLATPAFMAGAVAGAYSAPPVLVGGLVVAGALIGLLFVVVAVKPGRRSRPALDSEGAATIVDPAVPSLEDRRRQQRKGGRMNSTDRILNRISYPSPNGI